MVVGWGNEHMPTSLRWPSSRLSTSDQNHDRRELRYRIKKRGLIRDGWVTPPFSSLGDRMSMTIAGYRGQPGQSSETCKSTAGLGPQQSAQGNRGIRQAQL